MVKGVPIFKGTELEMVSSSLFNFYTYYLKKYWLTSFSFEFVIIVGFIKNEAIEESIIDVEDFVLVCFLVRASLLILDPIIV